MQNVIRCSCEPFRSYLAALPESILRSAREIRIRAEQPVRILGLGETAPGSAKQFRPTASQLTELLSAFCSQSLYAFETQIADGYLTLPGGNRVGLCGRAVLRDGKMARFREIQGMNIRIARQMSAGEDLLPFLLQDGYVRSALVVSPPGMGKTTLLRQFSVLLSEKGMQVALVDERGELAAMRGGVPQLSVGASTDVMEGCPKAQAIPLLIRSMAPDVVITDEIGGPQDLIALEEAVRCGVAVLASAHASGLQELMERPHLRSILQSSVFCRYIVLGKTPGHVCGVYDREGKLCSHD